MTRQEAMKALIQGKVVRHEYFSEDEWVRTIGGKIHDENAVNIHSEFWQHRSGPLFDEGWEIIDKHVAGVVCDNYKVEKFIEEFTKAGFSKVKTLRYDKDHKLLQLMINEDQKQRVLVICQAVEYYFKRRN